MLFSRAILFAALTVMTWLFGFTGSLLALLTLVQAVRGDIDARPEITLPTGVVFLLLALLCRYVAARIMAGPQR